MALNVTSVDSAIIEKIRYIKIYLPTEPPRRVMGYNTSSTSLFVTWLPLNGTWPQGRVVGYRVLYIPRNLISKQSPRQINTTEVSVHLKGLRRFTVYCIRVAAVINTTFQGPLSACAHATTDQDGELAIRFMFILFL